MAKEKKTAGRKPLPESEKKRQVNFYLTPEEEIKMSEALKTIRGGKQENEQSESS